MFYYFLNSDEETLTNTFNGATYFNRALPIVLKSFVP